MADVLSLVREATASGSPAALLAALDEGLPANAPPDAASTPLLCAVQAQKVDLVQVLLKAGAHPSAPDKKGVQPLHLAAFFGDTAMLKLLVQAGADVNGRDRHGQTPLFFAATKETCAELLQAGANPNLLNKKGQTAMHMAAAAGLTDVVQWLSQNMSAGLLNVQDKHGRTAFYCATKSDHSTALTAVLQKSGASTKLQPHKVWKARPAAERQEPPKSSAALLEKVLERVHVEEEIVAKAYPPFSKPPPLAPALPKELPAETGNEPSKAAAPKAGPPGLDDLPAPGDGEEFAMISPKRGTDELRHLSDEPVIDSEVLELLADSLDCDDFSGPPPPPPPPAGEAPHREEDGLAEAKATLPSVIEEPSSPTIQRLLDLEREAELLGEDKAAEQSQVQRLRDLEEEAAALAIDESGSEVESAARVAAEHVAFAAAMQAAHGSEVSMDVPCSMTDVPAEQDESVAQGASLDLIEAALARSLNREQVPELVGAAGSDEMSEVWSAALGPKAPASDPEGVTSAAELAERLLPAAARAAEEEASEAPVAASEVPEPAQELERPLADAALPPLPEAPPEPAAGEQAAAEAVVEAAKVAELAEEEEDAWPAVADSEPTAEEVAARRAPQPPPPVPPARVAEEEPSADEHVAAPAKSAAPIEEPGSAPAEDEAQLELDLKLDASQVVHGLKLSQTVDFQEVDELDESKVPAVQEPTPELMKTVDIADLGDTVGTAAVEIVQAAGIWRPSRTVELQDVSDGEAAQDEDEVRTQYGEDASPSRSALRSSQSKRGLGGTAQRVSFDGADGALDEASGTRPMTAASDSEARSQFDMSLQGSMRWSEAGSEARSQMSYSLQGSARSEATEDMALGEFLLNLQDVCEDDAPPTPAPGPPPPPHSLPKPTDEVDHEEAKATCPEPIQDSEEAAAEEAAAAAQAAQVRAEEEAARQLAEKAEAEAAQRRAQEAAEAERLRAEQEAEAARQAEEARRAAAEAQAEAEAERRRAAAATKKEAEERRSEAEAAKRRAEQEEAERRRLEQEAQAAHEKADAEEAERRRLEEEAEAARKKSEEEEAESQRLAAEAEAAKHRAEEEEAEQLRLEQEESAAKQKAEEEEAESRRLEEESEAARQCGDEENARRLHEEAESAHKKAEHDEAERLRFHNEADAARQKAQADEAEQRRLAEQAALAHKKAEEDKAARERLHEEAELARKKAEEDEAERRRLTEASELARKKAEEDEAECRRLEEEEAELAKKDAEEEAERVRLAAEAAAAKIKAEEEQAEIARRASELAEQDRLNAEAAAVEVAAAEAAAAEAAAAEAAAAEAAAAEAAAVEVAAAVAEETADSKQLPEADAADVAQTPSRQEDVRIACFDFDPASLAEWPFDDEPPLALRKGQRVLIRSLTGELPNGWEYGCLEDEPSKVGIFPANYTAPDAEAVEEEEETGSMKVVQTSPAILQVAEQIPVKRVISIWGFTAEGLDWTFPNYEPLIFEEGASITVLEAPDDVLEGWAYGFVTGHPGRIGLFPANYTEDTPDEAAAVGGLAAAAATVMPSTVVALYDFDGSAVDLGSEDRPALSLTAGERLELMQQPEDGGGWLLGYREGLPQEWGYFPENYIQAAGADSLRDEGSLVEATNTEEVAIESRLSSKEGTLLCPMGKVPTHRPMRPAFTTPVPKVEHAGLLCWVVRLEREHAQDALGFTHGSGPAAFARDRCGSERADVEGPQVLIVRRVFDRGMLAAWGEIHPDAAVAPMDRIYRVNNANTVQDMQSELAKPLIEIHIARYPELFPVTMQLGDEVKGLEGLGLQVREFNDKCAGKHTELTIQWINQRGALEDRNLASIRDGLFHHVVCRGMKIQGVNEVSGDRQKLRAALEQATGEVTLWIRRAEMVRAAFHKVRLRAHVMRQWRSVQKNVGLPPANDCVLLLLQALHKLRVNP